MSTFQRRQSFLDAIDHTVVNSLLSELEARVLRQALEDAKRVILRQFIDDRAPLALVRGQTIAAVQAALVVRSLDTT